MLHPLRLVLVSLAALAAALISGFFYAYHCSAMPGLSAIEPAAAIQAMQGINASVRNLTFAFSFFGTLGLGVAATLALAGPVRAIPGKADAGFPKGNATSMESRAPLLLTLAATVVYAVGAFGVTMTFNVPLNEALAKVTPSAETAAAVWRAYAEPWVFWNAVRMLASIVSLAAFVGALVALTRQPALRPKQHADGRISPAMTGFL